MMIRLMRPEDYDEIYALWSGAEGMGLRSLDDSREGISRFLERNPSTNFVAKEGNRFWETMGFTERADLTYRNLSINPGNT